MTASKGDYHELLRLAKDEPRFVKLKVSEQIEGIFVTVDRDLKTLDHRCLLRVLKTTTPSRRYMGTLFQIIYDFCLDKKSRQAGKQTICRICPQTDVSIDFLPGFQVHCRYSGTKSISDICRFRYGCTC